MLWRLYAPLTWLYYRGWPTYRVTTIDMYTAHVLAITAKSTCFHNGNQCTVHVSGSYTAIKSACSYVDIAPPPDSQKVGWPLDSHLDWGTGTPGCWDSSDRNTQSYAHGGRPGLKQPAWGGGDKLSAKT